MKPSERDKVHRSRRDLDIPLKDFNAWIKETYGEKFTTLEKHEADEIIDEMKKKFVQPQEPMDAPEEEVVDQDTIPAAEAEQEEPDEIKPDEVESSDQTVDEPEEYHRKMLSTMKLERGRPVICFYMSTPRSVFKLAPFIKLLLERNDQAIYTYQFGFTPPTTAQDKVRGRFIEENFTDNRFMLPLYSGGVNKFGTVDLLISTDPGDKNNKRIPAKHAIGVQLDYLTGAQRLAGPLKKFDKYFCWDKEFKSKIKGGGIKGSRIQPIGSIWLTHLSFLAEKRRQSRNSPDRSAAVYVPNPVEIPTRAYWTATNIFQSLRAEGLEVHMVRYEERQCWRPPKVKIIRDCLSPGVRNWFPSLAVAAPKANCEDAQALGIPIVRMGPSQVVTPAFLRSAKPEKTSGSDWIKLGCWMKLITYICDVTGMPSPKR